jgi:hypothetical protein
LFLDLERQRVNDFLLWRGYRPVIDRTHQLAGSKVERLGAAPFGSTRNGHSMTDMFLQERLAPRKRGGNTPQLYL